MKTLFVTALASLAIFRVSAQVSVELTTDQDEFLPNEAIRVAVKVINQSGQQLHLGEDPTWLTFSVESADGFVVVKNGEVPVVQPFDLESSQRATEHFDLQPYFQLGKPGRYKVIATMRIMAWGLAVTSPPLHFDVINGGELWSQTFGVMVATNAPPEPRSYTLIKANYLREQLRLYVEVSSGVSVYKVRALGPMVSFSSPEEQVDRLSQLHVLWQTGGQSFAYSVVAPDGSLISQETYDNFNSRPHLTLNNNGDVLVHGGVRRAKPEDAPEKSPAEPVNKTLKP